MDKIDLFKNIAFSMTATRKQRAARRLEPGEINPLDLNWHEKVRKRQSERRILASALIVRQVRDIGLCGLTDAQYCAREELLNMHGHTGRREKLNNPQTAYWE